MKILKVSDPISKYNSKSLIGADVLIPHLIKIGIFEILIEVLVVSTKLIISKAPGGLIFLLLFLNSSVVGEDQYSMDSTNE